MGKQMDLTMDERAKMLQSKTRAFTDEEIKEKFRKKNI
jgi:hypothetical protein